jgi:hypothetical protein
MEAVYIFLYVLATVYLLLRLIYWFVPAGKDPHAMISFWLWLLFVTLLTCGVFFLLVLYGLNGAAKVSYIR